MEFEDGYPTEIPFTKERFIAKAEEIAEFLTGRGDVEKVGIIGSLARGEENPTDIDLVLFVNEPCAMQHHLEQLMESLGLNEYSDDGSVSQTKKELDIEKIGLDKKELVNLMLMLFNEEANNDNGQPAFYPIDWIIIPSDPSDEFITLSTRMNFDPNFLGELSKDVLTYNPGDKRFEKLPYLNGHQKKALHNATTEALKVLIDDDIYKEAVKKSTYHQRRIQKARRKKHKNN